MNPMLDILVCRWSRKAEKKQGYNKTKQKTEREYLDPLHYGQ